MSDEELLEHAEQLWLQADHKTVEKSQAQSLASIAASMLVIARNSDPTRKHINRTKKPEGQS